MPAAFSAVDAASVTGLAFAVAAGLAFDAASAAGLAFAVAAGVAFAVATGLAFAVAAGKLSGYGCHGRRTALFTFTSWMSS